MVLSILRTARIASMIPRRRWLTGLICAICGSCTVSAWSQTAWMPPHIRVNNSPPVVSFDVFEPGPEGKIPKHSQTPPIISATDTNGVPEAHVGAVTARHIATISGAASGLNNSDLDIAGAVGKGKTVSNSERAALNWLARNFVQISDNGIVWHYTFRHTFNNIVVQPGWPSAFSQADVIKAFLVAYGRTSDKYYLDLAKRAAYAYAVPCEKGGLRCIVGDVPWFEEVPVPYGYAPMILNGHLYSVVMLRKLLDVAPDERIAEAFRVGVDSAKRMLLRYDTGYWSIYQQRPRVLDVFLALYPGTGDTEVHSVTVSSPGGRPSVLRLGIGGGSTYRGNHVWGLGWEDGDEWGRKLAGLGKITILPGRLSIDRDPIHAGALTVSVEYKSPGCIPPTLATFDYRARSKGVASIPPAISSELGDCPMKTYLLPASLNQWTTLNAFYHNWHTRLVTELWRMTRDPKFYATAVRWGRYAVAESELDPEASKDAIATPIFIPIESPEDDATVAAALNGRDPAKLTNDEVETAVGQWIKSKCIPHHHAIVLLARVGIAVNPGRVSACATWDP